MRAREGHDVVEFVIVRHGQTTWNASGTIQGQADAPLDELGIAQARVTAAEIARGVRWGHVDSVDSSDLRRAADTASVIAASSSSASSSSSAVRAHAALRERHAGSLQGIRRADAPARDPKAWKALRGGDDATRVPGGGESYDDVWDRVVPWFEDEARARARARAAAAGEGGGRGGGSGVVVTHGGVIHVLSDRCEADDECERFDDDDDRDDVRRGRGRVVVKNCAVGVLRLHVPREDDAAGERRVRWRIGETWGDASHLEEGGLRSSAWGGGAAGV